jgi:hypothetical protein
MVGAAPPAHRNTIEGGTVVLPASTSMTRRFLMNALVSVASIAAAMPAAIAAEPHPDAELLALNAKLDPIMREWVERWTFDQRHQEAWMEACERAGLPDREVEDFASADEYWAYGDLRRRVPNPLGEYPDPDLDGWTDIHDRMHPLMEMIVSLRARTPAGFAIQARTASIYQVDLWDNEGGEDIRTFVEAACAFAGVVPFTPDEAKGAAMHVAAALALPEPSPDPIFAAIRYYEERFAAFIAHCDTEERTGRTEAFEQEMHALVSLSRGARGALARTIPTTPAGLLAGLEFVQSTEDDLQASLFEENEVSEFIRSTARALKAMSAHLRPRSIVMEEVDDQPVALAIRSCQAALFAFAKILHEKSVYEGAVWAAGGDPDNRFDEAEERTSEVSMSAAWDLVATAPTTMKGLADLLRYVREERDLGDLLSDPEYRAMFHQSIEKFVCEVLGLPGPETAASLLKRSA